ncbi:MAG: homoserine O-acetyltransferase [Bacteroidales bacterium]|nr:MAG: homoserine O-acetyltransferase [Bacteroidales bacterium]
MKVTESDIKIDSLQLECGETLKGVNVRYHIFGDIEKNPNKIVWVCHAFTANSDPVDWWPGLVGEGFLFDPNKTPIICVNFLGSCYGTTGPMSINPDTGKPYLRSFPLITIRDMAEVHQKVKEHLGIKKIWILIGGSIGGFQLLEWEYMYPGTAENIIPIVCSAKSSPWVIAISQSQRLSLLADSTFVNGQIDGGKEGLKAARSIALLSYRGRSSYNLTQHDKSTDLIDGFRADSYQTYQGEKLVNRFDAYTYYTLTKSLDSHNMGRNRGGVEKALSRIKAKTLVVSIDSDILFPIEEQKELAAQIPNAVYAEIHSSFCHDGFLIEHEQLTQIIKKFLNS